MKLNAQQITPKKFVSRALFLFLFISTIQAFHLIVLSEFALNNIVIWAAIFIIATSYLTLLYFKINSHILWPIFNVKLFKFLFIATFIITLVFSRTPYVLSFFDKGLYSTRLSGLGGGGLYSYMAILFYPLCIMLAFIDLPRKTYYKFAMLMMVIISIDLLVLGTRGAPFFVLLFHVLMYRLKLFSVKSMILFLVGIFCLIHLIDYQTQARSLNTTTVGWDWVRTIRYSWIFDNLKIKESIITTVDDNSPVLFPLIYLSQYLTHSIAEFNNLLFGSQYDLVGHGLYLKDEICLVARCERGGIQEMIAQVNPRVGLYQTFYSSLLFDFGYLGVICLAIISLMYTLFGKVNSLFMAFVVYFGVVLAVSGIENYIYNGLGFARLFLFIVLWKIISLKFRMEPLSTPYIQNTDTTPFQHSLK